MNVMQLNAVLFALLLCIGCDGLQGKGGRSRTRPGESQPNQVWDVQTLIGKWVSDVTVSEVGSVVVVLEFNSDGTFLYRLIAIDESPPGELLAHGTYRVQDHTIVLKMEDDEKSESVSRSVRARIDGDKLSILEKMDGSGSGLEKESRYRRLVK